MSGSSNDNDGSGPDASTVVAIVALVVSVVALLGTLMQVTQQYYASAAGYSNVGEKTIGQWHTSKKRKFIWSELRFEVQFDAPVIFVCPPSNKRGPIIDKEIVFLNGTESNLEKSRTLLPKEEFEQSKNLSQEQRIHTADNERASWVIMLGALHLMERRSQEWQSGQLDREIKRLGPMPDFEKVPILAKWGTHTTAVALQAKRRTWDTMPGEIKKPYATTTICHIVEMAALLGLHWKEFNRSTNKYNAEGNGYLLTGREVDDLGIMFNFQLYGVANFEENRVAPIQEIKELAFGYVSTLFRPSEEKERRNLGFDNEHQADSHILQLGSDVEIAETLMHFGCNSITTGYFAKPQGRKLTHLFPVIFEVLGMLARPMYIPNTYLRYLPNPTKYKWNKKDFSLHKMLLEYNIKIMDDDLTPQNEHISRLQNWGGLVEQGLQAHRRSEESYPLVLLESLHNSILKCDQYLKEEVNRGLVILVLREHVQQVMRLLNEIGAGDEMTSPITPSSRVSTQLNAVETPHTFDDLASAGPEEKQTIFMDIYFADVLSRVMKSSHEVLRKKKSTHYVHSPRLSNASSQIHLDTPTPMHLHEHKADDGIARSALHHETTQKHATTPPAGVTFAEVFSSTAPHDSQQEQEPLPSPPSPPAAAALTQRTSPQTPGLSVHKPHDESETVRGKLRRMDTTLHDERVVNIWCTLLFRSLCWLMLHDFHKKDVQISKSEVYMSREPVYIA